MKSINFAKSQEALWVAVERNKTDKCAVLSKKTTSSSSSSSVETIWSTSTFNSTEEGLQDLHLQVKHWKEELRGLQNKNESLRRTVEALQQENQRLNEKLSKTLSNRVGRALSEMFVPKKLSKSTFSIFQSRNSAENRTTTDSTRSNGEAKMSNFLKNKKQTTKTKNYKNEREVVEVLTLNSEQIHHLAYSILMAHKWEYKLPLELGVSVMEVIDDAQKGDPLWAACKMIRGWLNKNPNFTYEDQLASIKSALKRLFSIDVAEELMSKLVDLRQ